MAGLSVTPFHNWPTEPSRKLYCTDRCGAREVSVHAAPRELWHWPQRLMFLFALYLFVNTSEVLREK